MFSRFLFVSRIVDKVFLRACKSGNILR